MHASHGGLGREPLSTPPARARITALALAALLAAPAAWAQEAPNASAPTVRLLSPDDGEVVPGDAFSLVLSLYFAPPEADPARTRVRLDGEDVTAGVRLQGDFLIYEQAAPVEPGPHRIEVELRTAAGEAVASEAFEVTVAAAPELEGPPPGERLSGRLVAGAAQPTELPRRWLDGITALAVRAETVNDATGSESFSSTRVGFDLDGVNGPATFSARVLLDTREGERRQPQHRFSFVGAAPVGAGGQLFLALGDAYPALPQTLASAPRVRGVHAGLELGYVNLEAAYGFSRRGVGSEVGETFAVTLGPGEDPPSPSNAVLVEVRTDGATGDLTYVFRTVRPGTFGRTFLALRPSFAAGRAARLGFTLVRVRDEDGGADALDSLGTTGFLAAGAPEESVALGTDLRLALDRRRIVLDAEAALALNNRDASPGPLSDEAFEELLDQNELSGTERDVLRSLRELLGEAVTVNGSLYPLDPLGAGLPGVALEGALSLNYLGQLVRVHAFHRGAAYRSLANPFLRGDLRGLRVSDRVRLMQRRLVANASVEVRRDNLSGTRPVTTRYLDARASVSYFPEAPLPSVTLGLGWLGRDGEVDDAAAALASPVEDANLRLFLTAAQAFVAAGQDHTATVSLARSNRDDAGPLDQDFASTFVQAALLTRFARLPLETRLGLTLNANDLPPQPAGPAGVQSDGDYGFTAVSAGVRYGFFGRRLTFGAEGRQTFGDLRRTTLRGTASLTFLTDHALGATVDYYDSELLSDAIVSAVYRYQLR